MSAIPQSFFNATIISAKREMEDLREKLLTEPKFMPREVVTEKKLDFIRWYYALAFLILMSTVEWFIRKYNGLT